MRRIAVLALFATWGCAPQNASVPEGEGSFTAFLAANTSSVVLDGNVDFDGSRSIDCVDGELPNAMDICDDAAWPPEHEQWASRDGFRVVEEPLDPWRGEAVMTAEGDLQITFHHALSGGEDFRFAFVVDPVFQPTRCGDGPNGVERQPIDGDWIANWSDDVDGTLFYLNSGAYQFNPSTTSEVWIFPNEWAAGYTQAKFAGEDFFPRTTRYGTPEAYSGFELEDGSNPRRQDLFYSGIPEGSDPAESSAHQELVATVQAIAEETRDEFALLGVEDYLPRVHGNEWRTPDSIQSGIDGWVELHYNWVRFDPGSEFEVGGDASGEFFLTYDGGESQSTLVVRGRFEAKNIKKDRWVTRDVTQEKLEENETVLCGEEPAEG